MPRCHVCNGRTIKTETGHKCMNAQCEGADESKRQGIRCKCGEPMEYGGLNSYGEPNYYCTSCGSKVKL